MAVIDVVKRPLHDLDFLVATKDPEAVIEAFVNLPIVTDDRERWHQGQPSMRRRRSDDLRSEQCRDALCDELLQGK